MAQDPKKQQQPSLSFLEYRLAVDEMRDNLPYIIEYWGIESVSMKARYDELQAAGFSQQEALEIIKARGARI